MADTAVARRGGSAGSGLISPAKSSRGGSRGETPGSSGRSSIVKNDVRRWKRMHEQNAMLRLTELRSAKKVEVRTSKENARKMARKIPIELLAKDWLSDSEATIEMRAYMVDKVMPTLILGVEKLLNAVNERGLASPEAAGGYDPDFNPLNYLAQYLLRNNPRFSNFSEASPYVRGLRQISEELKAQLFDMEDNRLARIKAEAKRKREERELQAKLRQQEKERRQQALMTQFAEWNVPTDNNRVELSLLQNALRSFMEVAEQFPPEIQEVAKFGHALESTDETGRTLAITEFAQYLSLYVEILPSEVFEQFMEHMSKCANAHRAAAERENRRIMLTNLFIYCDHSGIGLLDRHRILNLFEQFWDVFEDRKKSLRNPRKWPVVEVDEVDDSLSDDEEEGVPTIPETAREYEEDKTSQEKSELADKAGLEGTVAGGSDESQQGESGEMSGERSVDTQNAVEGEGAENSQEGSTGEVGSGEIGEGTSTTKETSSDEKVVTEQSQDSTPAASSSAPPTIDPLMAITEEEEEEEVSEEKRTEDAPKQNESNSSTLEDKTKPSEAELTESKAETAETASKQADSATEDVEAQKEKTTTEDTAGKPVDSTIEDSEAGKDKSSTAENGEETESKQNVEPTSLNSSVDPPQSSQDLPVADNATGPADSGAEGDKGGAEPAAADQAKPDASAEGETSSESVAADSQDKGKQLEGESEAVPEKSSEGEEAVAEEKAAEGEVKAEDTTGDAVIQIEDSKEQSEQPAAQQGEETEQKEEPSADPEISQDVDITGEIAKSGVQPRAPLSTPAATGRVSITFAQGTAFEREKTGLTHSATRSQSQMSAFDESNLNVSQFVQLTETFMGEHPENSVFSKLLSFLREGYEETEDEKMERLMKARKEAISANRKVQLDTLFEKWDNDGSGYLDLDEVEEIMAKYKEGQEKDTIARAREELKKQSKYHDSRLSRREFRTFVGLVIDSLPGTDAFEYFVEFLANSVERSYAERVRGEARKKWLQSIMTSAESSGVSLDPIYKTVFQALYRDAEAHGGEKKISANIAMLERNIKLPQRGDLLLRYTACTPEDAEYVLNRALYKDMNGISFSAVEQGKPIHVPRVTSHGNIQFWNTDRMVDEREGSFIVVPLKDRKRRVFGILGIDTLADPHTKAIFITHEIQYFQGVAQTFSNAYHLVDMRRKLLRITESAISWIKRRSPHVTEIMVYLVEPGKREDFVLRRMMTTDNKGFPIHVQDPAVRLERKDNLFRDYLFKSVDNSETVTADAYGNRQLAFPLRNDEGKAIAVVDISTGTLKKLPAHENKEIQRMLRLLQQAHKEITREFAGEEKMQVLNAEKDDDTRMDVMFDRLMLMELRDNVAKLDAKAYAELKAYNNPPQIVLHILRATLAIFYSDLAEQHEFDDWNKVKSYINNDLVQKIQAYDPTASEELITPAIIEEYLKDVPHGEVAKHGSLPAQHLYNWVFVCLSLIEHTRKMRQSNMEDSLGESPKEQ